jgi:hypothetical protein
LSRFCDATWIGGKDYNRHWAGKTGVIGAVERKGNVVAREHRKN